MAQEATQTGRNEAEKISIVGRNIEITGSIRNYVIEKITKAEEISPPVVGVNVYIELQREEHRVEILYKFSHFKVVTHAVTNNMYESIDQAVAKLKQKLRKWKGKIQDHHAKKLSAEEMSISVFDLQQEAVEEINDAILEQNFSEVEEELALPKIVKNKTKPLKTLSQQEALLKMELSNDNFLVYRSEEDTKLKVLYRRRDRTLGILEIE